jgi:cobalt-zinc-cadmium efflux system membrane fusion protein
MKPSASRLAAHLVGITVAASLASCSGSTPVATPPGSATPAAPAADIVTLDEGAQRQAGITVEQVRLVTRADQTEAPGLVALDESRTTRIGSLVDGVVLDSSAQVGDHVGARQILAKLHSHAIHDAQAGYRKAQAEERRLTTELTYAVQAHERAVRLYADKAIALQELQRTAANRAAAEQELDHARAEVRRSEEELGHLGIGDGNAAGLPAEFIPVRSPIRGVVLERLVTQGTAVTPGMPLYVVSDLSALWVIAEVDESQLSRVRTGRPVQVRVAAYPNEEFTGTIDFVGETINPRTRRVTVRSVLANGDGRLKPEMFATVVIRESEPRQVLVAPSQAVQTVDGRSTVFVAEAGGRFRPRPVDLGPEIDGLVEVRSGLTAGDRVVAGGSYVLKSELLKATVASED